MKTAVLSTCASQMIGFTWGNPPHPPFPGRSFLAEPRMFELWLKTKNKQNGNQWFLQCETIKTKKPNETTGFEHMCFTNDWFYFKDTNDFCSPDLPELQIALNSKSPRPVLLMFWTSFDYFFKGNACYLTHPVCWQPVSQPTRQPFFISKPKHRDPG